MSASNIANHVQISEDSGNELPWASGSLAGTENGAPGMHTLPRVTKGSLPTTDPRNVIKNRKRHERRVKQLELNALGEHA